MNLYARVRDAIVGRILGLDDTPHRIAWGVFLGCVVGATPTLGLQILLYIAVATLLRANKVSGIPIVFLTNPVTSVPFYYFAWKFGSWLLGSDAADPERSQRMMARLKEATAEFQWLRDLFSWDFWGRMAELFWDMGFELWVGCLVLGTVIGAMGYALTYYGVVRFRAVRADIRERRASLMPPPPRQPESAEPSKGEG